MVSEVCWQQLVPCPTGALQISQIVDRSLRPQGQWPASPGLSLAIPTYNEADNIQALIQRLVVLLDRLQPQAYEIIVVDDDSPDLTWQIALQLTSL